MGTHAPVDRTIQNCSIYFQGVCLNNSARLRIPLGLRNPLISAVGVGGAALHHLEEVGPAGDGQAVARLEVVHRVC